MAKKAKRTKRCPNCKERKKVCACIRNKCRKCGRPVGGIIFLYCDKCWVLTTDKL